MNSDGSEIERDEHRRELTNSVKAFSSRKRLFRTNCCVRSGHLSASSSWKSSATFTCVTKVSWKQISRRVDASTLVKALPSMLPCTCKRCERTSEEICQWHGSVVLRNWTVHRSYVPLVRMHWIGACWFERISFSLCAYLICAIYSLMLRPSLDVDISKLNEKFDEKTLLVQVVFALVVEPPSIDAVRAASMSYVERDWRDTVPCHRRWHGHCFDFESV